MYLVGDYAELVQSIIMKIKSVIILIHYSLQDIENLKKVYDSVEDIELFVGLTLEDDFDDALIGETFICLIAGCRTFQPQASTPDFFTMTSSTHR